MLPWLLCALASADEPDPPTEAPAGPPWPEPSDDTEDDPSVPCTIRRRNLDNGRWQGPEVTATTERATKRKKIVAELADEATARTPGGALTTSWMQDENGDYLVVAWQGRGIYRSYRFWDDAIVAFDLDGEGVQLVYSPLGCDERELMLAVTGAIASSVR